MPLAELKSSGRLRLRKRVAECRAVSPALRVADKDISKHLHANDRFFLPASGWRAPVDRSRAGADRHDQQERASSADLSNDASYAEPLFEAFGPRVIGLQITRAGDGMCFERRLVKHSAMLVYNVGRNYLLELLHAEMQAQQVRFVDGPMSRRAHEQLVGLQMELRESGTVYTCPSGQHDDLAMSCAMLVWAARHPHLPSWVNMGFAERQPRQPYQRFGWGAFT